MNTVIGRYLIFKGFVLSDNSLMAYMDWTPTHRSYQWHLNILTAIKQAYGDMVECVATRTLGRDIRKLTIHFSPMIRDIDGYSVYSFANMDILEDNGVGDVCRELQIVHICSGVDENASLYKKSDVDFNLAA